MTKFIRRLQRIGSSILVTLPKEWVDANKLGKSSQVEIETGQNSLSISINREQRPSKDIVISYPLPKDENIVADITGAYLLGYDIIKIQGKKPIPVEEREKIRSSMRRLVGMEIIDGLCSLFIEMERLFWPVSISTSDLLPNLLASTHSFGSVTRMLLPILCRRRMNLVNLY